MKLNNIKISVNIQGYLINFSDWNEIVAKEIAHSEDIELNETHWKVIYFVRTFYLEFKTFPSIRFLINSLSQKHGKEKYNSRKLFQIFPKGVIQQISKISGLPKPTKCL